MNATKVGLLMMGLLSIALLSIALPASAQDTTNRVAWLPAGIPDPRIIIARPSPQVRPTPPRPAVEPPSVSTAERAALRRSLAARRALNLRRFIAYREAGSFPDNHVQPGMLNVFIDDEGHICAAANLMALDGMLTSVQQVANQQNYLRLADVHSGPLYEWMLMSGFTQEEIATIQVPYAFIPPDEPSIKQREESEIRRLKRRFREVEHQLRRDARASLDRSVDRLIAYRLRAGIEVTQPIAYSGRANVAPHPAVTPVPPAPVPSAPLAMNTPIGSPVVWRPGMAVPN